MENKQLTAKKSDDGNGALSRLVIKKGNTYHIVKTKKIHWLESDGNYVRIYSNGQKYLLRATLKGLLQKLDNTEFQQIHRSTVVNIEFIQKIKKTMYGEFIVILKNGEELKMSRSYTDLLESI
ncbi:MAG: LytTR family DNA-binding domain-containing protein [Gracilimonas sp.]|nr:LytTR family DNA-binding domain-containing protein [Gracilimonas sp.]